ncbi:MAG: hypothetical protein ACRCUM_03060 [Mycoplasmoidaceae bacterium]
MINSEIYTNQINADYYLEKLDSKNEYNWFKKFFDITYIKSKINYNDTKLFFEFEINAISKSKLPIGTLLMNISFPGQIAKNIIIYEVIEEITENINNYPKELAKKYRATLELDISENAFFNRSFLKENIKINFDFDIDVEILNKYDFLSTNENLNQFFYEVRSKNMSAFFEYSNTVIVESSGRFNVPFANHFDTNGYKKNETITIDFLIPNYFEEERFYNLFSIKTKNINISINKFEIEFNYEKNGAKKLSINQFESSIINNFYKMFLNYGYLYNFELKKFEKKDDSLGIIFPFKTQGYYIVNFNLNVLGKNYFISLRNNFNINDSLWVKYEEEKDTIDNYEKI